MLHVLTHSFPPLRASDLHRRPLRAAVIVFAREARVRRQPGDRTGNAMRRLPLLLIVLLTASALPATAARALDAAPTTTASAPATAGDRKSTRLNSSP